MAAKSFIVTLKDHVADVDISSVKKSFTQLGGEITHEFSLIKGFTVKVPEAGIDSVKEKHSDAIANIEEDKEVSIKK
ncbi:LANO_0H05996g1_1 [Lachancea nothofagi CBS 11611]|uniref:LANO_0H05996g1_1 n=1 Tax=Lachancea nothofagi CBS 11611 TaxID=1266666 RepID=A0A1G4KLL5_9SACH|nr:LANO_0H05996g1_1 [Lachancea nothofagi CBS 11611]